MPAAGGLSIGGLYWYFKSKDAVVAAILARIFDADLDAVSESLASDEPTPERLRRVAAHFVATFEHQHWLLPVGIALYSAASYDDQARAFVRRYLARYRAVLIGLLEQGIARGEFRPFNAVDAANALLALEEGLALVWVADPDQVRYRESIMLGVELFVAGLPRN